MSLRRAALAAAIADLLMPVAYAQLSIWPKLVIPDNIDQTVQNITAYRGQFAVAILCYLITFVEDIIIAWALYVLLVPVNRALSLLTAWFRLVYTAVGLFAWLNLVIVFRVLTVPVYATLFGPGPLNAQVELLLNSFQYEWSMSLVIFGIHLVLLGYLIFRSGYIPWIIGILLVIDGVGWMFNSLRPYLYPDVHLGFFCHFAFSELILPLWLLIRGWKIPEPVLSPSSA